MGEEAAAEKCHWALTGNQILGGGGAHEFGELRLVEDGTERGGTSVFDAVSPETASEVQDGNGERVGVSMGADTNANTQSRFEHGPAYLSSCSVELPLKPSAKPAAPRGPIPLPLILSGRERRWELR